jgi:hypothetical protein
LVFGDCHANTHCLNLAHPAHALHSLSFETHAPGGGCNAEARRRAQTATTRNEGNRMRDFQLFYSQHFAPDAALQRLVD